MAKRVLKDGKIVFSSTMSEQLFDALEELAEDMGLSVTSYIRYLITKVAKENNKIA